jgi:quinol monooxygenase YgiN
MTFHLSGRLICQTEAEAERVRAHLPEHIRLTRAEPGCLSFAVEPTGDPLIWQIDEAFADAAAFAEHQTRAGASLWARETAGIQRNVRTWQA